LMLITRDDTCMFFSKGKEELMLITRDDTCMFFFSFFFGWQRMVFDVQRKWAGAGAGYGVRIRGTRYVFKGTYRSSDHSVK